jgi:hypothetical protein
VFIEIHAADSCVLDAVDLHTIQQVVEQQAEAPILAHPLIFICLDYVWDVTNPTKDIHCVRAMQRRTRVSYLNMYRLSKSIEESHSMNGEV